MSRQDGSGKPGAALRSIDLPPLKCMQTLASSSLTFVEFSPLVFPAGFPGPVRSYAARAKGESSDAEIHRTDAWNCFQVVADNPRKPRPRRFVVYRLSLEAQNGGQLCVTVDRRSAGLGFSIHAPGPG